MGTRALRGAQFLPAIALLTNHQRWPLLLTSKQASKRPWFLTEPDVGRRERQAEWIGGWSSVGAPTHWSSACLDRRRPATALPCQHTNYSPHNPIWRLDCWLDDYPRTADSCRSCESHAVAGCLEATSELSPSSGRNIRNIPQIAPEVA